MKTTIDPAGRLVIPEQIRQEAGLRPGMPLDVRFKLVRKGRLLVAVPERNVAKLAVGTVERTRQALRREHSPQA